MRKLVLAALAAGIMSIVAVAIVAAHDDHSSGQWPTSCVDLNDIVEEHLGRTGNVGIYQRTFGDQAEAACQNDHRNDVRSVFAWAIAETEGGQRAPQPTPASSLVPQPSPEGTFTGRGSAVQFIQLPGGLYDFSVHYNTDNFFSISLVGLTTKLIFVNLGGESGQTERRLRIDEGIYLMDVSSLGSGHWTVSWHKSTD